MMTSGAFRYAVVLAAGKGARFKSAESKVLHRICGRPMIAYLLDRLPELNIEKTFIVVDSASGDIREALERYDPEFIVQEKQLGTGHAIICTLDTIRKLEGSLLVLYGDTPFVKTGHLEALLEACEEGGCDEALLTTELDDPTGYGRIIKDPSGSPADIIEEREASSRQREIREINAGFACFRIPALVSHIENLSNDNRSGEYYLTDMVKILRAAGRTVQTVPVPAGDEIFGINDRLQLAAAEKQLQRRIMAELMTSGVTVRNPETVVIHSTVSIGNDTCIQPGTVLEGECRIGAGCTVGPNAHLVNAVVGDGTAIANGCTITDCVIGRNCRIGPSAHLRDGALLGDEVRIGNFVEVKHSTIGDGTTAAHLSYLGDAVIGNRVNIGAGTITCNFDGTRKNSTWIEDESFIGSGTQLIAPVRIGRGALVAAGSTITEDVPPGMLGIARSRQVNRER